VDQPNGRVIAPSVSEATRFTLSSAPLADCDPTLQVNARAILRRLSGTLCITDVCES
jgi:hypothetical protein